MRLRRARWRRASAVLPSGLGAISAARRRRRPRPLRARDIPGRPAPRADGALQPLPEQRCSIGPARRVPKRGAASQHGGQCPPLPLPLPAGPIQQGPVSPREACGSRVFLALALCMEEQCETPRFRAHPQCDAVRQMMERRRRSGD